MQQVTSLHTNLCSWSQVTMAADPEKKALAERLVREEKARWKEEWLEGQRLKRCGRSIITSPS